MHFLSRLRYGVKLYDGWGREIDLKALLRKGKKVDRWVYVGKKHPVWVRLVMIPLPKKEADERVRKACLPAGRPATTRTNALTTAKNIISGCATMSLLLQGTTRYGVPLR